MKNKSISFIIICVALIFSNRIYSQNAPVTSISSATACSATTITLQITLTNVQPIAGLGLRIDYDAAVLSFINPNPSSLPGNFYNTDANIYLYGGDVTAVQTNAAVGMKKVIIYWSATVGAATPVTTGGVASLCDLSFRYYGGNTTIFWDNSTGGGQNCEWTDVNGDPYIDAPTASFYVNGSVNQLPTPILSGIVTGNVNPCDNSVESYSVVNIPGATYNWTLPIGWTGTSATNSITCNTGATGSWATGTISVTASNNCGAGTPLSLFVAECHTTGISAKTNNEFSINNYPNPFNNTTSIDFVLPEKGFVSIDIYNVLGEHVSNIVKTYYTQGKHKVTFDASKLSQGLYPYTIKVNTSNKIYTKTNLMKIIK